MKKWRDLLRRYQSLRRYQFAAIRASEDGFQPMADGSSSLHPPSSSTLHVRSKCPASRLGPPASCGTGGCFDFTSLGGRVFLCVYTQDLRRVWRRNPLTLMFRRNLRAVLVCIYARFAASAGREGGQRHFPSQPALPRGPLAARERATPLPFTPLAVRSTA